MSHSSSFSCQPPLSESSSWIVCNFCLPSPGPTSALRGLPLLYFLTTWRWDQLSLALCFCGTNISSSFPASQGTCGDRFSWGLFVFQFVFDAKCGAHPELSQWTLSAHLSLGGRIGIGLSLSHFLETERASWSVNWNALPASRVRGLWLLSGLLTRLSPFIPDKALEAEADFRGALPSTWVSLGKSSGFLFLFSLLY